MTSMVPELDDIDFDRLVEDGRGLIPRYAPDWTDHNLHDPGITLIDLIAWLTDRHAYRIGFVGDSLRAAFTRLMGIAPEGPAPAEMLIWPKGSMPVTNLAAGTEIRSPDALEARFTLARDLRLVTPGIDGIYTWSQGVRKLHGNGLSEARDPLDLLPASGGGPQMLEIELAEPILPLADAGPVSLGVEIGDAPMMANSDTTAEKPCWDPVVLEQWDSSGFWRVLKTDDGTGGLRHGGVILFHPLHPGNGSDTGVKRFRLRLDQGFRPGLVTLTRLALNVLPTQEGWDDPAAVIGEGSGLPDQEAELETGDIFDRDETLVIEIDVGGVETKWVRRQDLITSGPDDAHYRLSETGIVFGNGLNGQLVPAGAQIRRGAVRRTAGAAGAVSTGLDWAIAGALVGTNIAPSTPGRDREGLGTLTARAREASRARDGVLSAGMLREIVMTAGLGLADVQVSAQRRPGLDGRDAPGSRTVLVLSARDPEMPPELPNERLRDEVEAVVAPLRLLGERIHVSAPVYVGVDVVLTLVVDADADMAALRIEAEAILRARLWDLRRRADVDPWPAGHEVTVGKIEALMARLPELVRVPDCRIARAGAVPGHQAIVLGDREIALAKAVTVELLSEGRAA